MTETRSSLSLLKFSVYSGVCGDREGKVTETPGDKTGNDRSFGEMGLFLFISLSLSLSLSISLCQLWCIRGQGG